MFLTWLENVSEAKRQIFNQSINKWRLMIESCLLNPKVANGGIYTLDHWYNKLSSRSGCLFGRDHIRTVQVTDQLHKLVLQCNETGIPQTNIWTNRSASSVLLFAFCIQQSYGKLEKALTFQSQWRGQCSIRKSENRVKTVKQAKGSYFTTKKQNL